MDDLISRAAAIDALGERPYNWTDSDAEIAEVCAWESHKSAIKNVPAVDAAPVVHGRWIYLDPRDCATISGRCSCCGWEAHYYEDDVADMPYCPNCGARMDGGSNG